MSTKHDLLNWPTEIANWQTIILLSWLWDVKVNLLGVCLKWVPQNPVAGKWILVNVMVWCRPATSHYIIPCRRGSASPCNVNNLQWVYTTWSIDVYAITRFTQFGSYYQRWNNVEKHIMSCCKRSRLMKILPSGLSISTRLYLWILHMNIYSIE